MISTEGSLYNGELSHWRQILDLRRRAILSNEESVKNVSFELLPANIGELSNAPSHPADAAIGNQELDVLGTLSSKNLKSLNEIDDALSRLDQGTYGNCQKCGEPISEARLEAMPETLFCISCAKEQESKIPPMYS